VDVFSPCALGGTINERTIEELKCKIIAGSANNQLEKDSLGTSLFEKNILYAPDYISNSGGMIGVFDEYVNKTYNKDVVVDKILEVKDILNKIFLESEKEKKAINLVANKYAEDIFNNLQ
jgi:leucine dehydrogenase